MRFVFALLVMASSAMAQQINSPTVWTKAQSPITVSSQLNLYSSLTIEAGVEVRFGNSARINFWNGASSRLTINGTATEPVIMRAATTAPWQGLVTAAVRSTRPVIRVNNAIIDGLGSAVRVFDLQNADAYFFGCKISGLGTVPAGYTQAGQATVLSAQGVSVSPIGGYEACEINGFGTGVILSPGMVLVDCDFFGVVNPIRGRLAGVSALGL